jgi:hypothetical protein
MTAQLTEPDASVTLPVRKRYSTLEKAAKDAPLAGDGKVVVIKIPASMVRRAEATIDRSPLVGYIEALIPAAEHRATGGPKRRLSVRVLCTGLLLLAMSEQAMILRDLTALLNSLHPSTKWRLGVPRAGVPGEGAVTERMVSALFNRIADAVDPSPDTAKNYQRHADAQDAAREQHAGDPAALRAALDQLEEDRVTDLAERLGRLQYLLDRGLDATLPDEPHTGSYAVDSSEVESWSMRYRTQPKRPHLYPDPDARHNGKGSGWYGYWLHGVVRIPEVGAPAQPCLVERISLTAANADVRVAALELIERMTADHELADAAAGREDRPRRDIIADRAYTSETRQADDWIWPLFTLGFDSVHALTEHQLGHTHTLDNGSIVIDGQPASPRMPTDLRRLVPPPVGASRQDIEAYQDEIAKRKPYMLHAVGGRSDDGYWDFGCRAMALLGQLRCDLKPASLNLPLRKPTTNPALYTPRQIPKICGQQKSRVESSELPFWQHLQFGSPEWFESWNRRNIVEGLFGNVKNDASQNLTRGRIRVMGLAKVSLMALFIAMAANLRLTDTFHLRQRREAAQAADAAAGIKPKTRKPRWRTRQLAAMREQIAIRQDARRAADALAGEPPQLRAVPDPPP